MHMMSGELSDIAWVFVCILDRVGGTTRFLL